MARPKVGKGDTGTVKSLDEAHRGEGLVLAKELLTASQCLNQRLRNRLEAGLAVPCGDGFLWSQAPRQASSDAWLTLFSELWL